MLVDASSVRLRTRVRFPPPPSNGFERTEGLLGKRRQIRRRYAASLPRSDIFLGVVRNDYGLVRVQTSSPIDPLSVPSEFSVNWKKTLGIVIPSSAGHLRVAAPLPVHVF